MRRVAGDVPKGIHAQLREKQARVDGAGDYASRVAAAKSAWKKQDKGIRGGRRGAGAGASAQDATDPAARRTFGARAST
ncbi:MAG: hypothetical protein H6734_19685 [Alphaproteobacteria bacterium]|nr:hypothetical protein [Alphaproteobacteria bacterium]